MVLSFLPGWARDPEKRDFFKFPFAKGAEREFFKGKIAEVIPEWVGREKPVLAETIYGARKDDKGQLTVRVSRVPLRELAFKSVKMKKTFSIDAGRKNARCIRDAEIKKSVETFLAVERTEADWDSFCNDAQGRTQSGLPGPRIVRVNIEEGALDEAKDLSKDGYGAWRVGGKSHRGQFVYQDKKGGVRIRPVYVFESKQQVHQSLIKLVGIDKIIGFFRANDLLELTRSVKIPGASLPMGRYLLKTLRKDGNVLLADSHGSLTKVFKFEYLLDALRHNGRDLR